MLMFGPSISTSLYVWDRGEPIKTGVDETPVTTCAGAGGNISIGVSGGYCQRGGKHGAKIGFSGNSSAGAYGYTSVSKNLYNNTKSFREHWNDTVEVLNKLTKGKKTKENSSQYIGYGVGSRVVDWGTAPSNVK